jgi:branched-chain amino acid aminotransferase
VPQNYFNKRGGDKKGEKQTPNIPEEIVMADNLFADGCAFIDEEYFPIAEARIPIIDTGFVRSDVTYDVVAVWDGKFFRLKDHLDRFEKGWNRLRMKPNLSKDEIREILFECVRRSGIRNAYVEMIMSRGIDEHGSRDPRRFRNRFYAYAIPYIWIVKPEIQKLGIDLVIAEKVIRIPTAAVDPTIKNFHWGDLTRGIFEAYDRGGYTAVLLDSDGLITEGPGFNVFAFYKDALFTPDSGVLEGITRRTVLELAEKLGIPTKVSGFGADVLKEANEVFITSTAGGIMPVGKINGNPVGTGKPGEITLLIREHYWEAHNESRWTTPIDYTKRL